MIETKYLTIYKGTYFDHAPKLFLDWYYRSPNLKLTYRDSSSFNINGGIFGLQLVINIRWKFVERPKNERELDMIARLNKLFESAKQHRTLDEFHNEIVKEDDEIEV